MYITYLKQEQEIEKHNMAGNSHLSSPTPLQNDCIKTNADSGKYINLLSIHN